MSQKEAVLGFRTVAFERKARTSAGVLLLLYSIWNFIEGVPLTQALVLIFGIGASATLISVGELLTCAATYARICPYYRWRDVWLSWIDEGVTVSYLRYTEIGRAH